MIKNKLNKHIQHSWPW